MIVKLLTEHHLEFLSLKEGCRGSSESTLVKMSNCWKFLAMAQFLIILYIRYTYLKHCWFPTPCWYGEVNCDVHLSPCDFQQCGILTCVDSDEPTQPSFKLRNSK